MKTGIDAIKKVYSVLKGGGGISVSAYLHKKPTALQPDEYVVINALPITKGELQKCKVNVNYYAKDIDDGVPDLDKLETMTNTIIALFPDDLAVGGNCYIEKVSQEQRASDNSGEHYSNIRLSVTFLN